MRSRSNNVKLRASTLWANCFNRRYFSDTIVHNNILHIIPRLREGKTLDLGDTIDYLLTLFSTVGTLLDLRCRRDVDAYFAQLKTVTLKDKSKDQMLRVTMPFVELSVYMKLMCLPRI
jgi:hypothetical protein